MSIENFTALWLKAGDTWMKRASVIIFSIYAIGLVFYLLISPPLLVGAGDAREYLTMTISFYNHLTPDLQDADIAFRDLIEHKNGVSFSEGYQYSGYFEALDGCFYSYHFWMYSLLNLPAFTLLHHLGLNELYAFQITNTVLFLGGLSVIAFSSTMDALKKLFLLLLGGISPVILYLRWPHPEVYSYSFLLVSASLFLTAEYRLALLFSAIASLQNPPIIVFTAAILLYAWWRSDWNIRELGFLVFFSLPSAVPFLFMYINYHTFNLIASIGMSSLEYMAADKILSLFFDLNFGMLIYAPVLLLLAFAITPVAVKRRDPVIPILWACIILTAAVCSTQINWNCGMMYLHRYASYLLPLILLIAVLGIQYIHKKVVMAIIVIGILSSAFVIGGCLWEYDTMNYLEFNDISKIVMVSAPSLYNPPHDVFTERAIGMETDYRYALPVFIAYEGEIRKTLTSRLAGPGEGGTAKNVSLMENGGIGEDFSYVNSARIILPTSIDLGKFAIYRRNDAPDIVLNPDDVFLMDNWHDVEYWGGSPGRWISNNGSLLIYSDSKTPAFFTCSVFSFRHPRTLEIVLNDRIVYRTTVTQYPSTVSTRIHLNKGDNSIRFHVCEGSECPCDFPELNNTDTRELSIAVQQIQVI